MSWGIYIVLVLLAALLGLISYVERLFIEQGKFLSREFEQNIEIFEKFVEPRLGVRPETAALSMALLAQLITAAISLLTGYLVFRDGRWSGGEVTQAVVVIMLVVVLFNRLLPYMFFTRTHGAWLVRFLPLLRVLIYLVFPVTLILGFSLSVASLGEPQQKEEAESTSEAVDALIEVGTEEGILEESDRELIQSVVEFGDKVVREVMTPRPQIVAVPMDMTIEKLTEVLRDHPFSRIPVYYQNIDHIKGLAFAHDVLQVTDVEARTQTVGRMLHPVYFSPETKRVRELLRELQREKMHMAVVIDEYGGVAGLATIEDMLEEIVGEISDEREQHAKLVRESDGSYVIPGSADVGLLEKLFGYVPAQVEATSVGGLISERLGRIPRRGDVMEDGQLRLEVLESTDRRVEKVRVRQLQPQVPAKAPQQNRAV